MPIYVWQCGSEKCAKEWEGYVASFKDPNPACECGSPSEKVWRANVHDAKKVFPYTTTHLNGQPIEIKSQKHLKSLEKQYGVRLRDDNAFLEKQYLGFSRRHGQVYDEGSGRGMPGSWI